MRHKHRTLGCLGLLAGCLGLPSAELASARSLSSAEQRLSAIEAQHRANGDEPADLQLALAAHYARLGDRQRTFAQLKAAQRYKVDPSRIELVLTTLYRREGRYGAAVAALLSVLRRAPDQPYALLQLWKTLYEAALRKATLGGYAQAAYPLLAAAGMYLPAQLAMAVDAKAVAHRLTEAGYQALLSGATRTAIQQFQAAIDALPSYALAHRGLGIGRAREHDPRRAAGSYWLYLELRPGAPDAHDVDQALADSWKSPTEP